MPSKKKRTVERPSPDGRLEKLVANTVIIFVMGVFLYDIFMQTEHWPFSSHRMYSTLQGPDYVKEVVFMVTAEGEVPLDPVKHLHPFGKSRVAYALRYLTRVSNPTVVRSAIQNLSDIYERNRNRHQEKWPDLLGLNVYRYYWALDPELANLETPQKALMIKFDLR